MAKQKRGHFWGGLDSFLGGGNLALGMEEDDGVEVERELLGKNWRGGSFCEEGSSGLLMFLGLDEGGVAGGC